MVHVCFLNKNLIEICLFLRQAKYFVYELMLKMCSNQVTTNPDIPLFRKIRDNRKSVDSEKIQCYKALHQTVSETDNLLELHQNELTEEMSFEA
ncbi:hypothetical protein J437_LFUL016488 [Ladona fulva]|uniref:Uncharacterized protein n=1 Tax=Ladona fulva TaxID=123851 RepID=A0A8K0KMB7_LADFU|nr:hypothetical protein J437_LFUL016488 [Ladona fulva]